MYALPYSMDQKFWVPIHKKPKSLVQGLFEYYKQDFSKLLKQLFRNRMVGQFISKVKLSLLYKM